MWLTRGDAWDVEATWGTIHPHELCISYDLSRIEVFTSIMGRLHKRRLELGRRGLGCHWVREVREV